MVNAVQSTITTNTADANGVSQIQLSGGYNFGFSPNLSKVSVANAQTLGAHVVNVSGDNTVGNVNFGKNIGDYGIRSDSGTLNISGGILGTGQGAGPIGVRNFEIGGEGNVVVNGSINDGNTVGNRVMTVDKYGTGTLTLKGTSLYEGATTVSGGTLLVNGSIAASTVTVKSSGILAGNGTVGGMLIQSGGTVAAGDSGTGILKSGDFTLEGAVAAELGKALARAGSQALAGTDYDQVNVTGAVALTGGDLKLTLLTGVEVNDLYFLVDNDGADSVVGTFSTLNGSLAGLSQGSIFTLGDQRFQISYTADFGGNTFLGGNDVALLAVVPEPGTWGLMAAGFGLLILSKATRRKAERA